MILKWGITPNTVSWKWKYNEDFSVGFHNWMFYMKLKLKTINIILFYYHLKVLDAWHSTNLHYINNHYWKFKAKLNWCCFSDLLQIHFRGLRGIKIKMKWKIGKILHENTYFSQHFLTVQCTGVSKKQQIK